jgi:creatinine amidohydrolase
VTDATRLTDLTWQEAEELLKRRPVGLLPIGAVEAHGPHLPLDTDIIIADATARSAAGKLEDKGIPAIVLPAIAYTVSFAGTSFPGTSPVDAQAFEDYIASVLTHLAGQGYRAIVCCNAHLEPAHVEAVQRACKIVEARGQVPVRSPDQRSADIAPALGEEFSAGARHAGSYETSILLATSPYSVRREMLSSIEPVWIDLPARLREGARTFLDAGSALGYFGDPASATEEEGHRLLDVLGDMIVDACIEAGVLNVRDESL